MKRKTLKGWVEGIVVLVLFSSLVVLTGESDNLLYFFGTKLIASGVMFICYLILDRYGRIFR